ncbi:MAG TPA: hydroxymyristoyl-ACP dehydratase [Methylibium sp.]|nr:hydroxymyristoyl-ACP dehydratase [Methylibium sp.]
MRLDRAGIERRVPHAGAMCLLDAVIAWDEARIECRAAAPDAGHPLARDGIVATVVAAEYAAQASAVHGALVDEASAPRGGLLVKLGEVTLHAAVLATDPAGLTVRAELLGRSAAGCLYAFDVAAGLRPMASGRLMVAFAAAAGVP